MVGSWILLLLLLSRCVCTSCPNALADTNSRSRPFPLYPLHSPLFAPGRGSGCNIEIPADLLELLDADGDGKITLNDFRLALKNTALSLKIVEHERERTSVNEVCSRLVFASIDENLQVSLEDQQNLLKNASSPSPIQTQPSPRKRDIESLSIE